MVHELIAARDEKRLLRLQRQLAAYKLLIIDELGYVPLSTTGAELLFEVFSPGFPTPTGRFIGKRSTQRGALLGTSNSDPTSRDGTGLGVHFTAICAACVTAYMLCFDRKASPLGRGYELEHVAG